MAIVKDKRIALEIGTNGPFKTKRAKGLRPQYSQVWISFGTSKSLVLPFLSFERPRPESCRKLKKRMLAVGENRCL